MQDKAKPQMTELWMKEQKHVIRFSCVQDKVVQKWPIWEWKGKTILKKDKRVQKWSICEKNSRENALTSLVSPSQIFLKYALASSLY